MWDKCEISNLGSQLLYMSLSKNLGQLMVESFDIITQNKVFFENSIKDI